MKFKFLIFLVFMTLLLSSTSPAYQLQSYQPQEELDNSPHSSQGIESNTIQVTFIVRTPTEVETLEIQILQLIDAYVYNAYPMIKNPTVPYVFNITLQLPKGGLLRYRYAIASGQWEYLADRNPAFRAVVLPETNTEISDEIVGFCPSFNPATVTRLNVTGQVFDVNGAPLSNGFIVIGGVLAPLRANGSFLVPNVFAGTQRILVFPYDHKPLQVEQNLLPDNDSYPSEIVLEQFIVETSNKVRLTFLVKAPDGTPTDRLKIVGDLPMLGYVYPYMYSSNYVSMQHLQGNWFIQTISVFEHVPFNYYFTLGTYSIYFEINPPSISRNVRSVVPVNNSLVVNEIPAWKNDDWAHIKFTVSVPINTPSKFGVFMNTHNSFLPMEQINATAWTTDFYYPTGWTLDYFYTVGQIDHTTWEHDYNSSHYRTITASDTEFHDVVSKWNYLSDVTPSQEETVNVTLTFTVPYYTPHTTHYLAGSIFGNWSNAQGKPLQIIDAHSYNVSLLLNRSQTYLFTVTRGSWTTSATKNFTVIPRYNGEEFVFAINAWKDLSSPWNRTSLITGVMPVDWWTPDMRNILEPAFKHYAENGGQWVEFSVVWNFDRLKPTTYLSSSTGVYTPDEDLEYLIHVADKYGLKVGLQLQFNREMTPDASQWGNFTAEEINHLLDQIKSFYLHYANLSQQLGIDFIAFARVTSDWLKTPYDTFMQSLIPEIRSIYSGFLTTHQGWTDDFQFYALLDFIGCYFWESAYTGSADPTIDELTAKFASILDDHYLPIYNKYHVPILFTQVAYPAMLNGSAEPSVPSIYEGTDVPYRPDIQARIYEALFRAILNRTWVEGLFSFGWKYWQSQFPDYSVSYALSEQVINKWANMIPFTKIVEVNNSNPVLLEQEDFVLNLFPSSSYTDIRVRLASDTNWSSWLPYSTSLNISDIFSEIVSDQQLVLWLQAKNGTSVSYSTAVTLVVDTIAPELAVAPLIYDFNLSNFTVSNRVIAETDPSFITFVFSDMSALSIDAKLTGPTNYSFLVFSSQVFTLPLDLLVEGNYHLDFTVTDIYGHAFTFSIDFTVFTTVPPTFVSTPPDSISFQEGTTGHVLSWIIEDSNPATYAIYLNGSIIQDGFWQSGEAINYSVDYLTVGVHNITFVAIDSIGLSASDTVMVSVTQTTSSQTNTTTSNPTTTTPTTTTNSVTSPLTSKSSFPILTTITLLCTITFVSVSKKYRNKKINNK